jgi:hypothetical protein
MLFPNCILIKVFQHVGKKNGALSVNIALLAEALRFLIPSRSSFQQMPIACKQEKRYPSQASIKIHTWRRNSRLREAQPALKSAQET